ncbi:branched-chain amino acid ABC transporter permease [Tuwongella immobilis]|uniref:Branched-chain amino acid ABC transporter permease n=1 Tax=Tuwongella immobilis TaxID=692036 RepID=A0A6C2YQS7_9BACT|nr:branched-chain amino acid ABC transporter permease [Tuwongella immobilis]VIP03836.1 inner-membrane translocator : Inner-membrane translocator OS=Pirellula staleyi (strain ATCC 27377 / DSM 6068 / ICPB 4128) GN=Psta_4549 PE=4 SV=1: BPD_transp_2 [Tuwongella immobilis]VTS05039.1 inner-membrane translocator : Inner-membrane translocator OS=Pirellula staleyi (strain ATCC 27377 / DSM 6068 / ICPB 4128) GN=Psta_4549 PE=4 SV=1: BPD_transp_2 [Tuwongella immobilis]
MTTPLATPIPPARSWKESIPWGILTLAIVAAYPLIPGLENSLGIGNQLGFLFIFSILALALNVIVGYTGLLHLGIAAFFGIGAYITGILTISRYPFQVGFFPALVASTVGASLLGMMISAPTLRLRGDYLALVTLGFGEVVRFSLRNLEEITDGTKGLNPIPAPKFLGEDANWAGDFRYFYYLTFAILLVVILLLRNIERSRLGRAWVALREDELATTAMGLSTARLRLLAFGLGCGLAGLAGSLYATRLVNTADPNSYDFNRSIIMLSCLILGGLGNRNGVLLGVFLILGFDNILAPLMDGIIQRNFPGETKVYFTFSGWRLMVFGMALILVMRYRPEGLLPSSRMAHELHPEDELPPQPEASAAEVKS